MKWVFITLLIGNLVYLGWELDRETSLHIRNQAGATAIPASAGRLQLLSELPQKPRLKDSSGQHEDIMAMDISTLPGTASETHATLSGDLYAAMPEPVNVENDNLLMDLVQEADINAGLEESHVNVCFSYGPFTREPDLEPLKTWFEARSHPTRQRVEYEQDKELFWVYLAPRSDRKQAVATISELENQGVKDYRLIQKGSFKNAISLGLFSSQKGVNRRLAELNAKGYQPVVVPYHDSEATRIYWLDVAMDGDKARVGEAFSGLPARYNSIPRDCDEIALVENSP